MGLLEMPKSILYSIYLSYSLSLFASFNLQRNDIKSKIFAVIFYGKARFPLSDIFFRLHVLPRPTNLKIKAKSSRHSSDEYATTRRSLTKEMRRVCGFSLKERLATTFSGIDFGVRGTLSFLSFLFIFAVLISLNFLVD